jgi:putative ABC transport system ATP-binding protein
VTLTRFVTKNAAAVDQTHEPTGDLDSQSATEVLEILKRLNEDFHKTIVMVTHDPHAASYAHVTRHLEKGMLLPPA